MAAAPQAKAISDDPYTSYTQPAQALLMPFDATAQKASYLLVSNVSGVSLSGAGVTTHWAFWSDTCQHLVDVSICLTLNDTVVVDPTEISAIDNNNHAVGPKADLTGHRGFVTVSAYETDSGCNDGVSTGLIPRDDALVGAYTIANLDSGSAYGGDAIGLGLDPSGTYTDLPDEFLSPNGSTGFLDVQTFNPATLDASQVIFLSVAEQSGNGPYADELGPLSGVIATSTFYDNLEVPTSLPDVNMPCALFSSVKSGTPGALIPTTVTLKSSGVLRLTDIVYRAVPVIGPLLPVGGDTWVYGIHGQAVGKFGGSLNLKYGAGEIEPPPPPTPTFTPDPTETPTPTETVVVPPTVTPTPTVTSTPVTPVATPTPTSTPSIVNPVSFDFEVTSGSGSCGSLTPGQAPNRIAGDPSSTLTCGGLSIGGGAGTVPEGLTPQGSINRFSLSNCSGDQCDVGGVPAGGLPEGVICTAQGCPFGLPLPILGSTPTCVQNTFSTAPSGVLNTATGEVSLSIALAANTFINFSSPSAPCPVCSNGGTLQNPGVGTCNAGANKNGACKSFNPQGLSLDCPPGGADSNFIAVGALAVDLTPATTAGAAKNAGNSIFCPSQNTVNPTNIGCFGTQNCTGYTATGAPAGALTIGQAKNVTLASAFCIPAATDPNFGNLVNAAGGLPGPGQTTLPGTITLH